MKRRVPQCLLNSTSDLCGGERTTDSVLEESMGVLLVARHILCEPYVNALNRLKQPKLDLYHGRR